MKASTANPLTIEAAEKAAHCLRVIAHPLRLKMIEMLLNGEHSVQDLADACAIPQHHASMHLIKMRDCGMLTVERKGRQAFYRVGEPALASIMDCIHRRFGQPA